MGFSVFFVDLDVFLSSNPLTWLLSTFPDATLAAQTEHCNKRAAVPGDKLRWKVETWEVTHFIQCPPCHAILSAPPPPHTYLAFSAKSRWSLAVQYWAVLDESDVRSPDTHGSVDQPREGEFAPWIRRDLWIKRDPWSKFMVSQVYRSVVWTGDQVSGDLLGGGQELLTPQVSGDFLGGGHELLTPQVSGVDRRPGQW